ncbi:MAG: acyl-CoA thioesterase [Rhodocyclaceae bacterium]|nr:acyl-CoA thioesterase [Rhodocyclaceae bacterium]
MIIMSQVSRFFLAMESLRHPVHVCRLAVRWGDLDALGHVNNTVYFRYAEQARIEWLASLGFTDIVTVEEGPVLVNAQCTFLKPLGYPATIDVTTLIGRPGRSSLPTFFEIRLAEDGRLFAEGAAKIVWWNPKTGKSLPLPDRLRRLYPYV